MFADVIVPLALPPLTYKIPDGLFLTKGNPVLVPLRRKNIPGIVIGLKNSAPENSNFAIKEIISISDQLPHLQNEILAALEWASAYYHYPIGDILRIFLPQTYLQKKRIVYRISSSGRNALEKNILPKGKVQRQLLIRANEEDSLHLSGPEKKPAQALLEAGFLLAEEEEEILRPEKFGASVTPGPPLSEQQIRCLSPIKEEISAKKFFSFLLQGVTGSGKTEIYLHATEHALSLGKNVLIIVPEIALTPQLVSRFSSRIGQHISVLHSGITDSNRNKEWMYLHRGFSRVCIGARSAALAPIQNLGLIIVDEEHESAFKQEDHLRYNARDFSIMRAKISSCPILLGSATPSLESYHNCLTGRYRHLQLPERISGRPMPEVRVVDLTHDHSPGMISPPLLEAMGDALKKKEQSMLLLNRRGFASFLLCRDCGTVPECPNCTVSLTHYARSNLLKCHYCGFSTQRPQNCPQCSGNDFLPGTLGTESLEEEVKSLFPQANVLRIDRESMEKRGALEAALQAIANKEVDIIIGTQMIAKGHDFPGITLVGVVNADTGFHLPDFRATERNFQLFTQMAGRAGRGDLPGKVIIQTYNPNHPSITFSVNHDYRHFAESELQIRKSFRYPPFCRLARVLITSTNPGIAEKTAQRIAALLQRVSQEGKHELMGPAPAALEKLQNKYRWHLLIKSQELQALHSLLDYLVETVIPTLESKVMVQVDVDPLSLM